MFKSVSNLFTELQGAYSPNTLRNYQNDYARFERFCNAHNRTSFPADEGTVANYIKHLSSYYRLATIQRNLAAITFVHKYMGHQDPAKSVLCEIELKRAKRHLTRHQYQAFGITSNIRDKMIASCDNTLIGIRDAALIHFAYDSMCRASELICAKWNDINSPENGNHTLLI
ncbi:site-specific integrase [Alphaproteobacteria bacterium]|nr:site-specific integrase [Alphaproteobacteria bacterium]